MWKKRNSSDIWPSHEWPTRLNQLIADAGKAGVSLDGIATALESAAKSTRIRAALTANLSAAPRVTRVG